MRHVQLTQAGLRERVELERRADAFACSVLESLSDSQRLKLTAARAEVERLLLASLVTISVADPISPSARWCIEQYFAELNERFKAGFDPNLATRRDRLAQ